MDWVCRITGYVIVSTAFGLCSLVVSIVLVALFNKLTKIDK